MIKVLSIENIKKSENSAISNGVSSRELMRLAGASIYSANKWDSPVAIVCGTGNNAGDGFVLASILHKNSIPCRIFLLSNKFSDDGKYYFSICRDMGVPYEFIDEDTNFEDYLTIVDCIFGTGFKGKVDEITKKVIEKINHSGKFIVSADINSGLNGDNGLGDTIVNSNLTVSIGYFKPGHFLNMAKDVMKKQVNFGIGFEPIDSPYYLIEPKDTLDILKPRKNFSNKSTYGYIAILGGSIKYSGATKLANIAASSMVSGAGVVKLAVPSSLTNAVSPLLLESTLFPLDDIEGHIKFNKEQIDELLTNIRVLAFGMGIGSSAEVDKMLSYILSSYSKTLLIDADGLNSLSKIGLDILRTTKAKVILTPHTKEMSRLSGYSVEEILQSPINITKELALKTNSIILLKGPTTIITDGSTVYLSSTGCAGMAKAGSGDVLSGVIAAICSYNEDNLLLATAVSAFITGYAGEIAEIKSSSISMLASDTVANIKDAISILVNNGGKTST